MFQNNKLIIMVVMLLGLGLLTGCQSAPSPAATQIAILGLPSPTSTVQAQRDEAHSEVMPTASSTPSPSATLAPSLTPSHTSTATLTPTATPTLTATPSPTVTETPTLEPSPTPDRVLAGVYYSGGCATYPLPYNSTGQFCVLHVTVNQDRHMIFNVSWTLTNLPPNIDVSKRSDRNNPNMYVVDNLGNRYEHIGGGGTAYERVRMSEGVAVTGWFEFGAPPPGAFSFAFHDQDNKIVIPDIRLTERVILYGDLLLEHYPLGLSYLLEKWELVTGDDGRSVLTHKTMPTCTLEERPAGEPQGKLKNIMDIGSLTYEIYGYIDQALNLGIREYLLVTPMTGVDAQVKPFLAVTIPLDTSQDCLLDLSEVLATLASQQP